MTFLRSFVAFWYDFIVGDSWILAAGVIGSLAVSKIIDVVAPSFAEQVLFFLLPLGLIATLVVSLAYAER